MTRRRFSRYRMVLSLFSLIVIGLPASGASAQVAFNGSPVPVPIVVGGGYSAPTQVLIDGDFEQAVPVPNSYGQPMSIPGWVYDSSIALTPGHCGIYGLEIGNGSASQKLKIPANVNGIDLEFWLRMSPQGVVQSPTWGLAQESDKVTVKINTEQVFSTTNTGQFGAGSWTHVGPISVSKWAGQVVALIFTGSYSVWAFGAPPWTHFESNIVLDDVTMWTGQHLSTSPC